MEHLYFVKKICLNINNAKHIGFDCRTFEILKNGNFQFCDKQNTSGLLLKNEKLYIKLLFELLETTQ